MLALNKIWKKKKSLWGWGRGSTNEITYKLWYYFSMEVELLLTGVL